MKLRAFSLSLLFLFPIFVWAQCIENEFGHFVNLDGSPCINPITTAVPFLNVDPNPQSMGLGGVGVVAGSNNFSTALSQNPALMARGRKLYDVHLSYFPLSRGLNVKNFHLLNLGGMTAIGDRQAVGLNFKYLSFGDIQVTNINGEPLNGKPHEYVLSGHYAYQLGEKFSVGMGVKFFVSDFGQDPFPGGFFQPVKSVGVDLGGNYRTLKFLSDDRTLRWDIGLAVNNVGPKVSYTRSEVKEFIPTILRFGNRVGLELPVSSTLSLNLGLAYQMNKLLVPTPCLGTNCDEDGNGVPDHREQSAFNGIINSFDDAPNGFSEEMREIDHHIGFDLDFNLTNFGTVGFRTGYSYRHPSKGEQQTLAFGASLNYSILMLDYAIFFNPESSNRRTDWMYALRIGMRDEF